MADCKEERSANNHVHNSGDRLEENDCRKSCVNINSMY